MSATLLVSVFAGALILELPVAFAMLLAALAALYFSDFLDLTIIAQRMAPGLDSFPLLAIPLFVFAGNLLNEAGVAKRIFDFALAAVGHIRGGLGHVVVVANIIMAGMSGVAQADAAALGTIGVKEMRRAGFASEFAAAVCAASAVVGPIIPPSVLMVLYASQTNLLLSDLFLSGVMPGLVLGIFFMITIYFLARTGRIVAPVSPKPSLSHLVRTFIGASPALAAPLFLIWGMLAGFATPTELGGIIVLYAILLGLAQGELGLRQIWSCAENTVLTCGVLVFIIAAAVPFGWILAVSGVPAALSQAIVNLDLPWWGALLVINVGLLVAGCVMETAAILLLSVPILAPIIPALGLDPVHFAMMVVFNLLIGTLTPPFGVLLFVLMDIARLSLRQMSVAVLPFYVPLVLMLILITMWPSFVLWLPNMFR